MHGKGKVGALRSRGGCRRGWGQGCGRTRSRVISFRLSKGVPEHQEGHLHAEDTFCFLSRYTPALHFGHCYVQANLRDQKVMGMNSAPKSNHALKNVQRPCVLLSYLFCTCSATFSMSRSACCRVDGTWYDLGGFQASSDPRAKDAMLPRWQYSSSMNIIWRSPKSSKQAPWHPNHLLTCAWHLEQYMVSFQRPLLMASDSKYCFDDTRLLQALT